MGEDKFLQVCDEKFNNIEKRLNIFEKLIEQIHNLSLSVESLAQSMKYTQENLEKQTKRIDNIELFNFNKYKGIIKMLLSALVGAVVAYIFKK